MKDIKITKDNYKELFECAGFKKTDMNVWLRGSNRTVASKEGLLKLTPIGEGKHFTLLAVFYHDGYSILLGNEVTSTAEIDRLFYPFLDKPLVWQKKWDFESVFERRYGVLEERTQLKALDGLYTHETPRVQAFSRLLFVMEELNKEYTRADGLFKAAPDLDGRISVITHNANRLSSLFFFETRKAVDLFIRDNEADLKTFFNIK